MIRVLDLCCGAGGQSLGLHRAGMQVVGGARYMTVRKRPLIHLSLSPDAIARLAEIATRCGETRSGVVERLIREAEMPRPRTAGTRSSTA